MGKYTAYRPFDGKAGNVYKLSEHVSLQNRSARIMIDEFNKIGHAWAYTEQGKNIQVLKLYCDATGVPYVIEDKSEGRANPYILIKKQGGNHDARG